MKALDDGPNGGAAVIGFLSILGGCVVALLWWAVRTSQRQSQRAIRRPPHHLGYRSAAGLHQELAGFDSRRAVEGGGGPN